MRESLRAIYSNIVVKTGLTKVLRLMHRHNGALIFVGHQVNDVNDNRLEPLPPSYLNEQLHYLKKHFQIFSLSQLLDFYEQNQPIPPNSVVITFDDGFRDNYTYAFPLLKKYHIPATIFLTTGCIDSGQLPWSQRLGYMVTNTKVSTVHLPEFNILQQSIREDRLKTQLFRTLSKVLSESSFEKRELLLKEFQNVFQVEPPKDRMLTWEMIKEMQISGIEFGGHTVSHPHLTKIPIEEAKQEIQQCLITLKEKLNIEKPSFAFPAGKSNNELVEFVRSIGFRSCFRSEYHRRYNTLSNSNPYNLTRLGLPNSPGFYLEAEVDGPLYWIRKNFQK